MSTDERYYRLRLFHDGSYQLAMMGFATKREWEVWQRYGKQAPQAVLDWVRSEPGTLESAAKPAAEVAIELLVSEALEAAELWQPKREEKAR